MNSHIAVVGGGIVGLASAYRLLCRYPDSRVTVLEKENQPAAHQTGHNSGVLHCGLYYAPGSLKARLAVQGIRQMVDFCQQHRVPYRISGKLVIATSAEEIPRLHALLRRGEANGLSGLRFVDSGQISEYEPHAAGLAAIHVPQEGVVDFRAVAEALVREIEQRGGAVRFSARVLSLQRRGNWRIATTRGDYEAGLVINCAGLHSDRVCKLAGGRDSARIVPFRGEYYHLEPAHDHLVRNLIYPVPDPRFPFLGVHFTRQIDGGVEAGPNAVLAFAREGYTYSDINLVDFVESLTYRGFWRFLMRYPSLCWNEFYRSFSKEVFCRSLQRLVPEIQVSHLGHGGSGVRAQALSPAGELLQDFHFVRQDGALHVLNAPSPAATASLAIADEILDRIPDLARA